MNNSDLINKVYKIADKHNAILKGSIKICGDVNCILFAYYCENTLFYKDFIKVTKDTLSVYCVAKKNLKEVKKLLKQSGYNKIWTKGVFSIYGDLRPLAVEASFGKWGRDGIVCNEKYGSDFLITAIFFK